MLSYLTRFILLALLCFGVAYLPFVREHIIGPFTIGVTHASAWLIQLWDSGATVTDNVIAIPGFAVRILDMCNGVEATLILWVAILAFPAPWSHRLLGLFIGTLLVHAVNIVRIVSLLYLGLWKPDWFHWVHWYLWDTLIMLDILLIFLAWMRWAPLPEPHHDAHAA